MQTCRPAQNMYFWTQNRTNRHFNKKLAQFEKILKKIYMIYGILCQFLCAKFSVRKFACAKRFTLRRSDLCQTTNRNAYGQTLTLQSKPRTKRRVLCRRQENTACTVNTEMYNCTPAQLFCGPRHTVWE